MSLSRVLCWITCKKFLEVVAPAIAIVACRTYNLVKHEMIRIAYYGFEKPKIKKSCRVHTKDWLQPSKIYWKWFDVILHEPSKKFVFWTGGEIKHIIFVYQVVNGDAYNCVRLQLPAASSAWSIRREKFCHFYNTCWERWRYAMSIH